MNWKKLTVKQFQDVNEVNNSEPDDFEKVCKIIAILFNYSYKQINEMKPAKFHKLAAKIEMLFNQEPAGKAKTRIGKYKIDYNVSRYKWRQFVEVQHFVKFPLEVTFHLILASAAAPLFGKNKSEKHSKVAANLLNCNFIDCFFSVKQIIENISELNGRFEQEPNEPDEMEGNENPAPAIETNGEFLDRWGWIYTTTRIAQHRGITLDQAYELDTIQALNDKGYIRDFQQYEENQVKNAKERTPID